MGGSQQSKMPINLCCSLLSTAGRIKLVRKSASQLGLVFCMIHDEIPALKFNPKDSLQKLNDPCVLRDFLQCFFMESGASNVLGSGNFRWKLFIYRMSPEEYQIYTQQRTGNVMEVTERQKRKIWQLFKSELDPCELHETLKNMGLVEEDHVMDCASRDQCMNSLIGSLVSSVGPDEGYRILLVHCMRNNYNNNYIWKQINAIYRGDTRNTNFIERKEEDTSLPSQKLFTADVTLSIQGPANMEIGILDPKWHRDTVDAGKEDIVIMGFTPDWEPTEEEAITTAAPTFSAPKTHDADEKSEPSILTIDSDRLESSELDQINSKQRGNSCNNSNISHHDESLNDQEDIIYQRQQPARNRSDFSEEHGPERKKIKLCDADTIQLNSHLPKVDNSAGPSTDGDQREIKQRQIESPYSSLTSAVQDILRCSDDYLSFIQEELEDTLFEGTHDQQQHIPQSMKMVCEQAHKCMRIQEEIVQMVLKLAEDL